MAKSDLVAMFVMKHIVLGVLTPGFAKRHLLASRREDALETRKGLVERCM